MILNELITVRKEKVLIVGTGHLAREVGQFLLVNRKQRFEVVGFIDSDATRVGEPVVNPKVIGTPEQILALVEEHGIRKLVIALPDRRGKLPLGVLLPCKVSGVEILDGFSFYEGLTGKVLYEGLTGKLLIEELRHDWWVFSKDFDRRKISGWLKRALDLTCTAMGLILAAPLLLLISLLIWLESSGPIFLKQQRFGKGGKPFTLFKFRSMVTDAETISGPVWAKNKDPRVTKVGRIIRRFRLDELPQLVNVLIGDMSFIGPRPDIPFLKTMLQDSIPYYSMRCAIKPGITGWAQVHSSYVSNKEEGMVRHQYDLYYIKNMSLALDLRILVRTFKVVLFGRGAR